MSVTDPKANRPAIGHDEAFHHRVRRAAQAVLGNSSTGQNIIRLCDQHERSLSLLMQDRAAGAMVLGVVGATGQGKSWLVRQLIRKSPSANQIRSGDNIDQNTEKLVWVGPQPPADIDSRYEEYLPVATSQMEPADSPYLLLDAPGATDQRAAIAEVSRRALMLASAILLVVRRDQIRGQTPGILVAASEGTIVIPVINTVRSTDQSLQEDTERFLDNLRGTAPQSIIAKPLLVEDFDVTGQSSEVVGQQVSRELMRQLSDLLEQHPDSDRRLGSRKVALEERFRSALQSLLVDQLPGLTFAVNHLNQEACKLPGEVAETLVGGDGPIIAAVRNRLRLKLLAQTSALWFPYRSILGSLNLTHGIWDRVLMSLSGSLPSLVSSVWATTQGILAKRDADAQVREGLKRRSAAAVTDRLGPLAARFREELAMLRQYQTSEVDSAVSPTSSDSGASRAEGAPVATLAGVDALQERSQEIFERAIDHHGISRRFASITALLGTVPFWLLLAGPLLAMYANYLEACYQTIGGLAGQQTAPTSLGSLVDRFPNPFTCVLLSLPPTAIIAMVSLSISQSNRRSRSTQAEIREGHAQAIDELQQAGILRLRWNDPLLTEAEFLVSAGNGN
ncbi:hypothetical protein SV7mr_12960 [Stieleria bergensis]|uniref:Uncharacterized protein n=1 Tax=Stieleria bergensis TaxID=2528025 RepID=A0A517SRN6_9BACT|nr:hypothetical protein SV7mr_12960 [Planctomycetes bacterium SV_7m_r]